MEWDLRSLTGGSGNFVNNVTKRKGNLALVENINFVVFDLNQLGFEPMIYHSNSRMYFFISPGGIIIFFISVFTEFLLTIHIVRDSSVV